MIHISFAAAFPPGHPEYEEGSWTTQAMRNFRYLLLNGSSYKEGWGGILDAMVYPNAPSALGAIVDQANQCWAADPRDRVVHILFAEGTDGSQWLDWLLREWPQNAGLVLALTDREGFEYFNSAVSALSRRHIMPVPCEPLSDFQAAHNVLEYLASTASS